MLVLTDTDGSNVQRLALTAPTCPNPTDRPSTLRRRASGAGLLALVCHVKTADAGRRVSVGVSRARVTSASIYVPLTDSSSSNRTRVAGPGGHDVSLTVAKTAGLWFTVYPHGRTDARTTRTHETASGDRRSASNLLVITAVRSYHPSVAVKRSAGRPACLWARAHRASH